MAEEITVTILGSGMSTGVPVIGCRCDICTSDDPKNKRLRSSILIRSKGAIYQVDTGPDFRQQMLREGVREVDEVFYTHTHADHTFGFDDVRAFSFWNKQRLLPIWLAPEHQEPFKRSFYHAFQETGYVGATPKVDVKTIEPTFAASGNEFETELLPHGHARSVSFRLGPFLYATDFKTFTDQAIARWRGKIHTMVASGIHYRTHHAHSTIPETVEVFQKLEVKRGIITHLSHLVDYRVAEKELPDNVELAFDGMVIKVEN